MRDWAVGQLQNQTDPLPEIGTQLRHVGQELHGASYKSRKSRTSQPVSVTTTMCSQYVAGDLSAVTADFVLLGSRIPAPEPAR